MAERQYGMAATHHADDMEATRGMMKEDWRLEDIVKLFAKHSPNPWRWLINTKAWRCEKMSGWKKKKGPRSSILGRGRGLSIYKQRFEFVTLSNPV